MKTTSTTRLIGVLAHPVEENLFHTMLATAVEASGADAAFMLFDAQPRDVRQTVDALRALHASGLYLTGRLRMAASDNIDYLSDEAHGAGAINTIVFDGDHATGHNTEARAIISVLEEHRKTFENGSGVILGGGPMARSAAYALVRHFRMKFVAIANRTVQQAQLIKEGFAGPKTRTSIEVHELFPPDIAQLLAEARVIINATSVGTGATLGETPIGLPDILHSRQIVLDANYQPTRTRLLGDAEKEGATVIDGSEILLRQIQDAFELMTGATFPMDAMREVLAGETSSEVATEVEGDKEGNEKGEDATDDGSATSDT